VPVVGVICMTDRTHETVTCIGTLVDVYVVADGQVADGVRRTVGVAVSTISRVRTEPVAGLGIIMTVNT